MRKKLHRLLLVQAKHVVLGHASGGHLLPRSLQIAARRHNNVGRTDIRCSGARHGGPRTITRDPHGCPTGAAVG